MTIDEALKLSATMQSCWLVWRTDTGELVSIEDADTDPDARKSLNKGPFPVKGRWLPATNVTCELLQDEEDDCHRVFRRVAIFHQWAHSSAETLVQILERSEFEKPFVGSDDAKIVMELLFHLHADELTDPRRDLRDRLNAIFETETLSRQFKPILAHCRYDAR